MPEKSAHTNRLANEKSPYLRQHAQNPVDWYPWGGEAFDKAKAEDKPVFLSIGYSTCHWCHVMAHESFESEEAAAWLNAHFVPVKVDREERPDIDTVYMEVCQAMTGSGGWPLTIIMTPEKKPFYAGTYFPLHDVYGRMGLITLLKKVSELWRQDKSALAAHGEKVAAQLSDMRHPKADTDAQQAIEAGFSVLERMFDEKWGGFSGAPKFPMPHYLLFLMDISKAYGINALGLVKKTLDAMYRGGIFDHVGGGFSRYSTDERWLVPHFEKMLYDNALLLRAYIEGYAATGDHDMLFVAEKTAQYIMRDMQAPQGGYDSAEDADSEGEEGLFYVWSYDELKSCLNADEFSRLELRYGVKPSGNFEGKNILNRIGVDGTADAEDTIILNKLFALREKRIHPFKDTKISASWNGLAIEAFSRMAMVTGNPLYMQSAKKAADFVLIHMTQDGALFCGTYLDGAAGPAFLPDYANMINGLLMLFTATRDLAYLKNALKLADKMLSLFADEDGFAMSAKDAEKLFMRPRDEYDGAMPSGSACAVMALVSLWQWTGSQRWRDAADAAIAAMLPMAAASPSAHIHLLSALMRRITPDRQIVISAEDGNMEAAVVYQELLKRHAPFDTVFYYDRSEETDKLFAHLSQYKSNAPFAGYVCENFTCKKPVFTPGELLDSVSK